MQSFILLSPTQYLTLFLPDRMFTVIVLLVDFKKCLPSLKRYQMSNLRSYAQTEYPEQPKKE